jgi:uncharacterized membrane protein YdjX (TVP38/TMEM64 family)
MSPRLSRGIRFAAFIVLVVSGLLLVRSEMVRPYLVPEKAVELLDSLRDTPGAPLLFVAASALGTTLGLPGSIVLFTGGAVFGVALGATLGFVSLILASALSFWIARSLAHDFVVATLGSRLDPIERLLERSGFWTLFRLRFMPLPFPFINYAAALAGFRFGTYIASSALSLAPGSFVITYFSATLVTAAEGERAGAMLRLVAAFLLFLALSFVPSAIKAWSKRRAQAYR